MLHMSSIYREIQWFGGQAEYSPISKQYHPITQLLYGHPLIIFITLPLGCLPRICLIKTLLEKNPVGKKNLVKEKEYNILLCDNLPR